MKESRIIRLGCVYKARMHSFTQYYAHLLNPHQLPSKVSMLDQERLIEMMRIDPSRSRNFLIEHHILQHTKKLSNLEGNYSAFLTNKIKKEANFLQILK